MVNVRLAALLLAGGILCAEGDRSTLEPLYREALARRRAELGEAHPKVADSLIQLGLYLQSLPGRRSEPEAQRLLREAAALREKLLGPSHPSVAEVLEELGTILEARGAGIEALTLYRRALPIRLAAGGPALPKLRVRLAGLLEAAGDDGATAQWRAAAREFPEGPERALAQSRLAAHVEAPSEAASLYREAITQYEAAAEFAEAASIRLSLASVLEPDAAGPVLRQSLAELETHLGSDHPRVAVAAANLAGLLLGQRQFEEAERLYRRALAIDRAAYGDDHEEVAGDWRNLAAVLSERKDLTGAIDAARRAQTIYDSRLPKGHPDRAVTLYRLAALWREAGRLDEALPLLERAVGEVETGAGPNSADLLPLLGDLAAGYQASGEPARAEPALRRAAALSAQALPPDHPETIRAMFNLAFHLRVTGRAGEAAPLLREVAAAAERVYGPGHPLTLRVRRLLQE
ncbi:MAG: tetratricopeptide repeat protein [Bryobacterales bacterium]|nr:tetratricopeptide repeat protein [Bryobacterales bacterium]